MLTIAAASFAYFFLDGLARFVVIGIFFAVDIAQIFVWLRWRGRRSITGAESMAGLVARVVTDCDPEGQVEVKGQIWQAVCKGGAPVGEKVRITEVDGIRLVVERDATLADHL